MIGAQLSDTITFTESAPESGVIEASLFGPVPPFEGSCTDVDFTSAPLAALMQIPVTGSGTFHTGSVPVTKAGCYTWGEVAQIGAAQTPVVSLPGQPAESTVVTAPIGSVQGIVGIPLPHGVLGSVATPDTGMGPGAIRSAIISALLLLSGLVILTGVRRHPYGDSA